MSTTTPNFGWTIPSDTDLVTDGAAAMRDLGDGIDTSFVDLNGGTTGQILSKTSATDLDFTWITNDVGDITSVGVTSPITGGGSSGAVTIAIQDASTAQKGSVMLSDSTSTTSSILAATPTAVKAAYDLANGAIAKTLTTTTGDTIYASAANTPARLGIGSTGQVLTVAGGVPTWATVAGGTAGLNLISTTALTGSTSYSINNCFSATYVNYKIILTTDPGQQTFFRLRVAGADNTSANYKWAGTYQNFITGGNLVEYSAGTDTTWRMAYMDTSGSFASMEIFNPFLTKGTGYVSEYVQNKASTDGYPGVYRGATTVTTSYTGFTVYVASGTFTGSISVYGYGV